MRKCSLFGLALISIIAAVNIFGVSPAFSTAPPATFGFGGFLTSYSSALYWLDKLKSSDWNSVRFQAMPPWEGTSYTNWALIDYVVAQAKARNITVYLDLQHNYPPNNKIHYYVSQWLNRLAYQGSRYNSYSNVVIEIWNEYTGSDQVTLANQAFSYLRSRGINLRLHVNLWWNQKVVVLNDPIKKYSEGRHLYGTMFDNYNPTTPISLDYAYANAKTSGGTTLTKVMYSYFEWNNPYYPYYHPEAERLGIPWVVTELGGSYTPYYTSSGQYYKMGVGNMAYVMKFLELAKKHGVTVIMHRIGTCGDYDLYYKKAWDYFRVSFGYWL